MEAHLKGYPQYKLTGEYIKTPTPSDGGLIIVTDFHIEKNEVSMSLFNGYKYTQFAIFVLEDGSERELYFSVHNNDNFLFSSHP